MQSTTAMTGNKQVVVIGAGLAGLAAGAHLQRNGFRSRIVEMHIKPGGLCTAWNRKGYTFDGCVHWLVGSNPDDPFWKLWSELIDMDTIRFVNHEEFFRIENENGSRLHVFNDVDQLEDEWLSKAPEDHRLIRSFTKAIRKFSGFKMPVDKAPETLRFFEGIGLAFRMAPIALTFMRWLRLTGEEFASRARNPLLRKAILNMFEPRMAAVFLAWTMAWMNTKNAGYPVGGSLPLAEKLEKTYRQLGGIPMYGKRVKRILTREEKGRHRATGVELSDGETIEADVVISAADGYDTIFNLLDGHFLDQKRKDVYSFYEVFPSYLQVSFGVALPLADQPHMQCFPLRKPLKIDEQTTLQDLNLRIFNFDPTMAPPGKTVLTSMLTTRNHEYWCRLRRESPGVYASEKKRIADEVLKNIESRVKGVTAAVEARDVSTPASVKRYTNNWRGSYEGWLLTPRTGLRGLPKTLPGLENFYMAGQWVEPGGGLPTAIMSGRNAVQLLCRKKGLKFKRGAV